MLRLSLSNFPIHPVLVTTIAHVLLFIMDLGRLEQQQQQSKRNWCIVLQATLKHHDNRILKRLEVASGRLN